MLTVDQYKDINEYDVYVTKGNLTYIIWQGIKENDLNNTLHNTIKRFDLRENDLIQYNIYENENWLLTTITEPLGSLIQ